MGIMGVLSVNESIRITGILSILFTCYSNPLYVCFLSYSVCFRILVDVFVAFVHGRCGAENVCIEYVYM